MGAGGAHVLDVDLGTVLEHEDEGHTLPTDDTLVVAEPVEDGLGLRAGVKTASVSEIEQFGGGLTGRDLECIEVGLKCHRVLPGRVMWLRRGRAVSLPGDSSDGDEGRRATQIW